ncbi:bacillithiol biosynthesis cysteine-adding enzyme BshC [Arthrospiribacter ruber]|uniref:Putative cysteine ligase BshC n=1 Tax=Arthrospiribacter ruber TaxID=2487934 RepID=A0A951IUW5_9BACT|nr:bacillithiol biosynthesis cysteine-adding enzyme BshC [Arthrospiribacter ruber]MBW3467780.1 bacillithiol biosynthesis cysteine-adding enzyme BshC [Arthrospiribacter ruber]
MNKTTVEPACTGQFSQLFLDYIGDKPELRQFYNLHPSLENLGKLAKGRNFPQENREILSSVLKQQYQGIEHGALTAKQIDSLKQENTFTVTTGHQLNLFTGPLYFIYKIVSTVRLAERLNEQYPDMHFVPVYWMATEDHDFEEINYFKLDGKKYQWNSSQKGPVGEFLLDESFKDFFKTVQHFVPDFFREAYLNSKTLSEAVRKYVHAIFGSKGLLILDGHSEDLKRVFGPVMKDDLLQHQANSLCEKQTKALDELGYKSQVYPRQINLFYMGSGSRERLEKSGTIYKVLQTDLSFTEEELLEELEKHPERFSPNVVLRPLYQEMVLPNIAYLGGPAEVAYWLQLKRVFDCYKVPLPAIMPRNFAVVLNKYAQRKAEKLGLKEKDLFEDFLEWKRAFVVSNAQTDIHLTEEKEALEKLFAQVKPKISGLEKSLVNAFEAGEVRAQKILDQLANKVRKAEERKLQTGIRQRVELLDYMNPGGSPQERVENFMKFYLEDDGFVEKLFGLFDPLDFGYMILRTENE